MIPKYHWRLHTQIKPKGFWKYSRNYKFWCISSIEWSNCVLIFELQVKIKVIEKDRERLRHGRQKVNTNENKSLCLFFSHDDTFNPKIIDDYTLKLKPKGFWNQKHHIFPSFFWKTFVPLILFSFSIIEWNFHIKLWHSWLFFVEKVSIFWANSY